MKNILNKMLFGLLLLTVAGQAQILNRPSFGAETVDESTPFITQWTVTAGKTFTFPLTGVTDVDVDFGDGTGVFTITGANLGDLTHTFVNAGTYDISAKGNFTGFNLGYVANRRALIYDVLQWGEIVWTQLNFNGSSLSSITATDIPVFAAGCTFNSLFANSTSLSNVPNIESWDVENVTNFKFCFTSAAKFNQDISAWNISNGTDFTYFLSGATLFDQDLSNWDVSHITNFLNFFTGCGMTYSVDEWDVSNATTFSGMFSGSCKYAGSLGSWTFKSSGGVSMSNMFNGNKTFDGDGMSNWDMSKVTNTSHMLRNMDSSFVEDISGWDMSNVTNATNMFYQHSGFNQDLSLWDMGKNTNFQNFFRGTAFNQDVSGWDVSSGTRADYMFYFLSTFDQDLSSWDMSNMTILTGMMATVTLSTANYDALLIGWDSQVLKPNVTFDAGNSTYTLGGAAETARTNMINSDGWNISDGGGL